MNNNMYHNNKSNPISGIMSLLLIVIIIIVGLMAFNVIDNPLSLIKKDNKTLEISPKSIELKKGESYQIGTIKAQGAVEYKSSDPTIADVNEYTGYIIGKKAGTATVTAYLKSDNSIKDECIVKVESAESKVEVKSISFNKKSLYLTVGGSSILSYSVSPANANIRKIYWSTSNKNIATVDKYGKVVGKNVGTATITIRTENGTTSKCTVTVSKKQSSTPSTSTVTYTLTYNANGGTVSPPSKELNQGSQYGNLPTPTRKDYNFTGWYTTKDGGTKIDSSTKINGNTTIYAHWTNTSKSNNSSITLNRTSLSLDGGDSYTLIASGISGNKTWTSSNPRVATVDNNGKVTANVAGTSTITVTSDGVSATCTVNVSLNIKYHEIRYQGNGNTGTSIWYAIIPSKYKMHFAFGEDKIGGAEKPSEVAKRVNATIAVNSQIIGFPIINGNKLGFGAKVSGYNFTIKQNPSFKMYDVNTPPWDALIVTGTTDFSQGISFKDINLGFDYEGDHVNYNGKKLFLSLFAQIIMKGKYPSKYNPVNSGSEYYKKYYNQQETRQQERIPRTWIAYDSKGNQFVGVAMGRDYPLRDGRTIGQHGLTYQEIIKVTQKYFTEDIVTLFNIDGGGSSTFVYKGEKLNGNGDIDENGNRYERVLWGTFYW